MIRRLGGKYILEGKVAKPCLDLFVWAQWFETANRTVAKTLVGNVMVSTVFLGLDHNYSAGPPLVFETMIFGGEHDQHCERCSTWEEAEAQHAEALALLRPQLKVINGGRA